MDKEELKNRTKQLAHRCIRVATKLPVTRLGRHIESQMIRSLLLLQLIIGQYV